MRNLKKGGEAEVLSLRRLAATLSVAVLCLLSGCNTKIQRAADLAVGTAKVEANNRTIEDQFPVETKVMVDGEVGVVGVVKGYSKTIETGLSIQDGEASTDTNKIILQVHFKNRDGTISIMAIDPSLVQKVK